LRWKIARDIVDPAAAYIIWLASLGSRLLQHLTRIL
jgi:hypothetical protein